MQLLIDTDNMATDELAVAVNMLDDILQLRRKPSEAVRVEINTATDMQRVIDSLGTDAGAAIKSGPVASPPPPAVPLTVADVVSDSDPEIEIDDEGTVTALTTSVQLQAPPPPPSVVPPAAVPAPPGPPVAAEMDSRGYPWDGRIHASNRAKKIDGSWKNKRGVDANLVVACEAQNKPGNAPSTATVPAAVASVPAVSASTPLVPPPPPAVPPVPAVPSVVTSSAAPSTGLATTPIDFRGLMQKIQQAQAAKKLTDAQVNAALLTVGLQPQDMAQLIGNTLYIASVNAAIDACLSS